MSRKISMVEKRKWLEEYETGLSEYSLCKKYHKDIRTIKDGIEAARLNRDISAARIQVMREVLIKHQSRLLERLRQIQLSIKAPKEDLEVLSWRHEEGSVFSKGMPPKPSTNFDDQVTSMLREHLPKEKLWKLIDGWSQAQIANAGAREALQRKIFSIIKALGFPLCDQSSQNEPCLYIDIVGPMFYRWGLKAAFSPEKYVGPEDDIVTRAEQHAVMFRGTVLTDAADNLEETRTALIKAFRRVRRLEEVQKVKATQEALEDLVKNAQQAIEEILLMDYVAGDCPVCRRLSQT